MSAKLKVQAAALMSALALFAAHSPVFAGDFEKIEILKISPEDGLAVIKGAGGKMEVIKTGDVLQEASSGLRVTGSKPAATDTSYELRVIEIAKDRVVLEEKKGDETEKVIIRLENGKQRVERLRKTPEKHQGVYKAK